MSKLEELIFDGVDMDDDDAFYEALNDYANALMLSQAKDEFYTNIERELKIFEKKLDKWNATKPEAKRLKGQLEQTLSSLKLTNAKRTGCGFYSRDKMMFDFLKDNLS